MANLGAIIYQYAVFAIYVDTQQAMLGVRVVFYAHALVAKAFHNWFNKVHQMLRSLFHYRLA
jgi:ABC-type uncharacterized transport system permease subunit